MSSPDRLAGGGAAVALQEIVDPRAGFPELPVRRAIGVREIAAMLRGEMTRDEALTAGRMATRRYAKRQETWFRHQLGRAPVVTLDATESPEALAARIAERWERERGR